jgi:hypothetical protein
MPSVVSEGLPKIQVLGAYRVPITPALFESVLHGRYASDSDTPERRERAVRDARAELDDLILFDVLVERRDHRFAITHFGQDHTDQAAYDERYLSSDGTSVIASGFDIPAVEPLRIVFFLHFVDLAQPLSTSYGEVQIPAPSVMPEHLRFLAPYTPID